ncbi:MAG: type transport system ATP-binding protein [Chloroflexota bacterium]|nr:type transport system ATP-binding protein [Chloroflexota bacterium]
MADVITCQDVKFAYGDFEALRGMSFAVQQGQVIALLGPNGAGKTTTIRLLNGLLRPAAGRCAVLGLDPAAQGAAIRRRTGVLTETPALYERLTAWQNLHFFGALADMSKAQIEERGRFYLDVLALSERADDRVETYSKGMKQRLALARALLHDPELLFLDEPTSGMDPYAARQVEELIYRISKDEGRSVILCTHRLFEAEKVCDTVAIMQDGRVVVSGSMDELRRQVTPEIRVRFEFQSVPAPALTAQAAEQPGVQSLEGAGAPVWNLRLDAMQSVPPLIAFLAVQGAQLLSVVPQRATLEDIYLKIQGQEEQEGQKGQVRQ